jgi:hypothetical protein
MVPTNNDYLPAVHNSKSSPFRPLTPYDRSAFYVEEQPALMLDTINEWNSQQMEHITTPAYTLESSASPQHHDSSM